MQISEFKVETKSIFSMTPQLQQAIKLLNLIILGNKSSK